MKVHFIGIGGIGTSALARWFLTQNWAVSGSDIVESKITQELRKEGVKVKIGHKKANLDKKTTFVIYNQAISPSNPELQEARRFKIKCASYPEALGELTRQYKTVAVAGAHGKSTVTAFVSLVLMKAGFDPTVVIGTRLKQFGGPSGKNFRRGRGEYLIIEACEWKNAFLNYSPFAAIITNIDREHLDFFKNLSNIKKSFLKFVRKIQNGGTLVLNKDDKNLFGLKSKIQRITKRRNLRVFWYSAMTRHSVCSRIRNVLKVPGEHNFSNALAAFTLAKALKIKEKTILAALSEYSGIWRRLEFKGNLKIKKLRVPVYDDYAHHPAEIKASLSALREKYPRSGIICVFEPHQAERLKSLFKDFASAFDEADNLILLPVYEVSGRDKKNKKFSAEKLAKAVKLRNSNLGIRNSVFYLPYPEKLKSFLGSRFCFPNSSVIVMMGAGDIFKQTDFLLR